MKIKPLTDKIIVEPLGEEETTKGGIVLPDTAKEEPQKGKVVAVSSGKYVNGKKVSLEVKVGDIVLFGKWPDKVKIEGKEYCILKEEDILAIIQ